MTQESITKNTKISPTDKKLLRKLYLRSLTIGAPLQYANEYGSGFEYSILPFIDHYYKNGSEEKRQALKRHIVFYNITQYVGTFCQGLVASMEKQASQHEDYDVSSISAQCRQSQFDGTNVWNWRHAILGYFKSYCCWSRNDIWNARQCFSTLRLPANLQHPCSMVPLGND